MSHHDARSAGAKASGAKSSARGTLTFATILAASALLVSGGLGARALAQAQAVAKKRSAARYLGQLAPMVVGRPLSSAERARAEAEGAAAVAPVVRAWVKEPRFLDSVRHYTERRFSLSGKSTDIDYDAPGHLAVFLERTGKPYAGILTHDQCVDSVGRAITCGSGAPFAAGVLTSRAFLAKHGGAFNIARAAHMMRELTCSEYPFSQEAEPSAPQADLIEMFATTKSNLNFGFGNNCYLCHGQFSKHAQLFVKFDAFGRYLPAADGMQDPNPAVAGGTGKNATFVSHFKDPARAKLEASEMFGKPVANLAEAGQAIAAHPSFNHCTVRWILAHYMRLKDTTFHAIPLPLLERVAESATRAAPQPTFGALVEAALSDPVVIESYADHGKQGD